MSIPNNLIEKIIEASGKQRGKIIIDGLDILKTELDKFQFKPKKHNQDKISNLAYNEAIKKLKQVNYRPFAIVGLKGSVTLKKNHDIDIVFLPAERITSGVFLAAISEFTKIFKKSYKRKTGKRAICFPQSIVQEEIEYLSKRKGDELFLHFVTPCEHFYGKNIQNPAGIKTWMPDNIIYRSKSNIIKNIPETRLDRVYLALNSASIFGAEYPINV